MLDFIANLNLGSNQELNEQSSGTITGLRGATRALRTSSPSSYWHNGVTYFGGIREDADNNTMVPFKWDNGVLSYKNDLPTESYFDPAHHDAPTVQVIDGYAYYIKVDGHGQLIRIYRFDITQDISTATLYHSIAGYYSYCNLQYFPSEGRLLIMSRAQLTGEDVDDYSQFLLISEPYDFKTWTVKNPTRTTDQNYRHYPGATQYYGTNTWKYIPITCRMHSPNPVYYKHVITKTNDFITFYNIDETFSKNIDVAGKLTVQEIEDYFTIAGTETEPQKFYSGLELVIIDDTIYCSYFNPDEAKWYFRKILPDGTIIDKLCLIPNINTSPDSLTRDQIVLHYNGENLIVRTSNNLTEVPQIYSCDLNFGNLTFQMDLVTDLGTEFEYCSIPANFPNVTGSYVLAQSLNATNAGSLAYVTTSRKFTLSLQGISRSNIVYPPQSANLYINSPLTLIADISGDNITKTEWYADGVKIGERVAEPFDQFTYTPTSEGIKAYSVKTFESAVLASTSEEYDLAILALQPNTVIGNASTLIPTKVDLATKLGINEADISYFNINGVDVEAIVEVNYTLANSIFRNTGITFYKDFGKKLTGCIGGSNFRENSNFNLAYLPVCTTYNDPSIQSSIFTDCASDLVIYTDTYNETSNGGNPDADLVGFDVRYIADFTKPSAVNDFSAGEIYSDAILTNFTTPASTNIIDYYEVFNGGNLIGKVTEPDVYLIGLTASTNYADIKLVTVDEFYNRSDFGNAIDITTNTTPIVDTANLAESWNFNNTSGDLIGYNGNNGVLTGTISRGATPLISAGKSYDFSNGEVRVPHSQDFWLNDGTNNKNIGISQWMTFDATNPNSWFLNKRDAVEYQFYHYQGDLGFAIKNTDGSNLAFLHPYTFVTGKKYHFAIWTDILSNKIYLMINGEMVSITTTGTVKTFQTGTADLVLGMAAWNYGFSPHNGKMDQTRIFISPENTPMTQAYFLKEYNKGNGITL